MSSRSAWVWVLRSVPLGRNWRTRPFQFSLVPRWPGAAGVAEVDGDSGGHLEAVVGGHLGALVPGERTAQLGGQGDDAFADASGDVVGGLVVEFDQHPEPGGTLHQRGHGRAAVFPDDEIAFPNGRARLGRQPRPAVERC